MLRRTAALKGFFTRIFVDLVALFAAIQVVTIYCDFLDWGPATRLYAGVFMLWEPNSTLEVVIRDYVPTVRGAWEWGQSNWEHVLFLTLVFPLLVVRYIRCVARVYARREGAWLSGVRCVLAWAFFWSFESIRGFGSGQALPRAMVGVALGAAFCGTMNGLPWKRRAASEPSSP